MSSHPRKLTAHEVEHLADKCLSRGLSDMLDVMQMETEPDMLLLVSVLLRNVAREHPDGIEADMSEVLA